MKSMIRQLHEDRGESQMQLADGLGAALLDIEVQDPENGLAGPSVTRLRPLTKHVGVHEEVIDREPNRSPSLGEQLLDAINE